MRLVLILGRRAHREGEWEQGMEKAFIVFLLFRHCFHARTHALTGARTHGRTYASFIALIAQEDENTVSSSFYLGALLSVPFSRGVGVY